MQVVGIFQFFLEFVMMLAKDSNKKVSNNSTNKSKKRSKNSNPNGKKKDISKSTSNANINNQIKAVSHNCN